MIVEIKFKTEAYFTAVVELSEHQIKAFENNLVKHGWIGGNEPKADGFRKFFVANAEFDYIDSSIDIEDVTMERLPKYPYTDYDKEEIRKIHSTR